MGKVKTYNVNNLKKCHTLLKLVCEVLEVDYNKVKTMGRGRKLVDARRMYCVVARKFLPLPLSTIGKFIKRDHSSVVYYLKQHYSLMETDSTYEHFYNLCEYAASQGKVEVSEDSTVDYIEALVAENKYLKLELDSARKQLFSIQKVLTK